MRASCPACGARPTEEDRFCARCGTALEDDAPLTRYCTACGTALEVDARFCPSCGTPVRDDEEADLLLDVELPVDTELAPDDDDLLDEWVLDDDEPDLDPQGTEEAAAVGGGGATWAPPADAAVTEAIAPARPVERTATIPTVRPSGPPMSAPRPAAAGRRPSAPYPWGATFALLGGVVVIVSSILPWRGAFGVDLPRDIPAVVLVDPGAAAGGISLGVLVLVAGAAGALIALLTMVAPLLRFLRRIMGLLTLAIPIGFALRTLQEGDGGVTDLPGILGAGVYVAAVGALIQLLAGRWFRR